MGSVYQRDVDAYQRAVDQYMRKVRGHNRQAEQYNASRVTDAQGRMLVADARGNVYSAGEGGKLARATLPQPLSNYGLTALPGDPNFRMLRQNPTERRTEQREVAGGQAWLGEGNQISYFSDEAGATTSGPVAPGAEWSAVGAPRIEHTDPENQSYVREHQTYQRDASTYAEKPGELNPFKQKTPSATFSQLRNAGQPSMAQQEAGLIGEVFQGRKAR